MICNKLRVLSLTCLLGLFGCSTPRPEYRQAIVNPDTTWEACGPSREYVATFEYLRENKMLSPSVGVAREIAQKVSSGCAGSARRFIHTTELLSKAGLGGTNAAELGIKYALLNDVQFGAFVDIFQTAYLKEGLDLPIGQSVSVADTLAQTYGLDLKVATSDFQAIAEYCIKEILPGLPRARCVDIATKLTLVGGKFQAPIAGPFQRLYSYLKKADGPNLPVGEAFEESLKILENGPEVGDNFIEAFSYAMAKDGLSLPIADSMRFAGDLSKGSYRKLETRRQDQTRVQ